MLHARTDEKRDPRSAKACKRSTKRKRARAAFRGVLFRQPERVDGKVCSPQPKKEKANEKPRQNRWAKIENLGKRKRDENHHQREIERQCPPPSESFCKPRHRQTPENRRERHQHRCARSKLGRLRPGAPSSFRECCHSRGNVN